MPEDIFEEREDMVVIHEYRVRCMNDGLLALGEWKRTGDRVPFQKWLVEFKDILKEESEAGNIIVDMENFESQINSIGDNLSNLDDNMAKEIKDDFNRNLSKGFDETNKTEICPDCGRPLLTTLECICKNTFIKA